MPLTIYTDKDGRRVIVRNVGPPGIGIPAGGTTGQILVKASGAPYATTWANSPSGTGAVVGPASAGNGNFALFDGTTGKLVKDSTYSVSYFATKSYADTKVDIDGDKVLSDNNFSDADKSKLDLLSTGGFRGSYATVDEIEDIVSPQTGDRAYLEVTGQDVVEYLYDSTNELWFPQSLDATDMTGAEIADVLFDTGEVWTQSDCLIFTPTYKAMIDSHDAVITAFTGGGSGFQPLDATLTAFSGLVNVADRLPYFTGIDTMAVIDFTSAGRALVSGATAADQRTTLGIGTTDIPQVAGLAITSGSTARCGTATLVAGSVVVNNAVIAAGDKIFLSRQTIGGTVGNLSYTISAGVSFTITSSSASDTSAVNYLIVKVV